MASSQSRAVFLACIQRAIERSRENYKIYSGFLPEAMRAKSISAELESITVLLTRLTEDTRTQAFIEFAARVPAKLDDLIYDLIGAYSHSSSPGTADKQLASFRRLFDRLRESIQLLRKVFSISLFEYADSGFGRMVREDRLQFLERLDQAAFMIEEFDSVLARQSFATPKTRKQRGKQGARTLFTVMMAGVFEKHFGKPHNELVADLADVLFDGVKDTVTGDSVRSAHPRPQAEGAGPKGRDGTPAFLPGKKTTTIVVAIAAKRSICLS